MRRLHRAIAGTATVVGLAGVAGCGSGEPEITPDTSVVAQPFDPSETNLYMDMWSTPQQYEQIGDLLGTHDDVGVTLAFSELNGDEVLPPKIPPAAVQAIAKLPMEATVTVAIGGYGDQSTRDQILDGLDRQAGDPAAFADRVSRMAQQVSRVIGRPVNGFDLDWEYPREDQADKLGSLLYGLDRKFPNGRISLAVPASENMQGFLGAMEEISKRADVVHVMTYDMNSPYDNRKMQAGPVATRDWMLNGLHAWQQRLQAAGGKAVAAIGFPGYCYSFDGAEKSGDRYHGGDTQQWSQTDPSLVEAQPDGSSAYSTVEGWTSCFSPDDVRKVLADMPEGRVPVFAWSAKGMTDDYLQALAGR